MSSKRRVNDNCSAGKLVCTHGVGYVCLVVSDGQLALNRVIECMCKHSPIH
jgi:hypothetical protein